MAAYTPSSATTQQWIEAVKEGKPVVGCAINSSSPLIAELVASMGFDFLLIDAQHSAVNPETLRTLLTCAHAGGAKAFVRVGGHTDRMGIQQALDLGADGILVPCVRTVEDVKLAVSCAKYPMGGPGGTYQGGTRSVYLNLRPQFPGGAPGLFDYIKHGNAKTIVAVQIETKDALENVEDICNVEGLDIAFIGPGDLAVDMGLAKEVGIPECWADDRFIAATKKVAAAAQAGGKVAGYWNANLKEKIPLGFRFFVTDGDVSAMQTALATSLQTRRADAHEAAAPLR